jgi:flagella basal body P-ring formation protein FlgA
MILLLHILLSMDASGLPANANCHAIETDVVQVRDVVTIVPAFAQLPPEFLLGYVASNGTPRLFHGADLERIAKNRGVELHDLPEVCFVRKTFIPTADQIRDAVAATLAMPDAKIAITSSSQHEVPTGKLEFPRSGLQAAFGTSQDDMMWRGAVRYNDNATAPVWARVRITATMTRVVASADLPSGKPISVSQVRLETCEDSPLDDTVVRNLNDAVGYITKASLRQTMVIHRNQIERAADVARGDDVVIDVYEGGAHLRIEARAQTSGSKGSVIMVRNTASGHDFHAQVTGKGMAIIGTPPQNTHGEIQ